MRKLLYAGAMILLAGCAQVGVTKKADVRSAVGQPTKITFTDSGEEIWDYKFESYQATPQQFIPFIGPLFAGEVDEHSLTVRFRPDGVVKEVGKGRRSGTGGL